MQTDPIGYADDMNLYAYVGNNPLNRTDPEGLFVTQLIGGAFNAAVGAAVTYSTGGATTEQYLRNAAVDFGVGALSSGVAGVSKVATLAKVLNFSNASMVKAATAAIGEVGKGIADGKSFDNYAPSAIVAGALNGTGVVGKAAGWVAKKAGLVVDAVVPDPAIARLLQPKPVSATLVNAASLKTEIIGSLPSYGIGVGAAKVLKP